jgi:hypothetical protein
MSRAAGWAGKELLYGANPFSFFLGRTSTLVSPTEIKSSVLFVLSEVQTVTNQYLVIDSSQFP